MSTGNTATRARGRGNSRGGLGKYLRARGRRGVGRPAEFNQRLLLEDEQPDDEVDEEEIKQLHAKYAKRDLNSNADRYEEKPPDTEGVYFRNTLSILTTHDV